MGSASLTQRHVDRRPVEARAGDHAKLDAAWGFVQRDAKKPTVGPSAEDRGPVGPTTPEPAKPPPKPAEPEAHDIKGRVMDRQALGDHNFRITLAVGSEQGVRVGMEGYLHTENGRQFPFKVKEVGAAATPVVIHWEDKDDLFSAKLGVINPSKGGTDKPVQKSQDQHSGLDDHGIRAAAAHGVSGSGGALPHLEAIQRSFGAHDVTGVRAHVGGTAREASDAMGAHAYATGNDVAFADSPSLFLAAHEAAHVVQQRAGVQLSSAVGQVGDRYEQHADAVAARVVAGESAEDLLGAMAGGGGAGIQRDANDDADFDYTARSVVRVMHDVLNGNARLIDEAPKAYRRDLRELLKLGSIQGPYKGHDAVVRFQALENRFAKVLAYAGDGTDVPQRMQRIRADVRRSEATERVEHSMLIGGGGKKTAIELGDETDPRATAAILRTQLPKLIDGIQTTLDRAKTVGEHAFPEKGVAAKRIAKLEPAIHILTLAGSWLKLTDDEFLRQLGHIKGVLHGVETYSDLVKTIVEITGASIGLTIELGAGLAKLAGEHAMEHAAHKFGSVVSAGLGKLVAGIEIVHGLSLAFGSGKSAAERAEGALEVATGVSVLAVGSSVAALPIVGPYAIIKLAQHLFSGAALGWEVGILKITYERLADAGKLFSTLSDQLVIAHQLAGAEKDPERKVAMEAEEKRLQRNLSDSLYRFLEDCSGKGHGIGELDGNTSAAFYPGNIGIMRTEFSAAVYAKESLKSGKPDDLAHVLRLTIESIVWCFKNAQAIVKASAIGKRWGDVPEMQKEIDEQKKEKE